MVHVLGSMDRGGIEQWLVGVLREAVPAGCRTLVLTRDPGPFALDAELARLGVPRLHCPGHPHPPRFHAALAQMLRDSGCRAVHSHLGRFNGMVLRTARQAGIAVRISHAHSDERWFERREPLWRRPLSWLMRDLVRRHATQCIAVSAEAAAGLHGPHWRDDPRVVLMPGAIDIAAAEAATAADGAALRGALGLPTGAGLIGSVGRLAAEKRQVLLVEALVHLPASVHLVLVGEGPARAGITATADRLGLAGRVHLTGARGDVATILAHAMDAFLLPSASEGLGLAAVEAQAAGLPCVLSSAVPDEAVVIPARVSRLPLDAGASAWAGAAGVALGVGRADPLGARKAVAETGFTYAGAAQRLSGIWRA